MPHLHNGPARIQSRNLLFKCARRFRGHLLKKEPVLSNQHEQGELPSPRQPRPPAILDNCCVPCDLVRLSRLLALAKIIKNRRISPCFQGGMGEWLHISLSSYNPLSIILIAPQALTFTVVPPGRRGSSTTASRRSPSSPMNAGIEP